MRTFHAIGAFLFAAAAGGLISAAGGCGGGPSAGTGGGPTTTVLHPGAAPLPGESACTVTETTGVPIESRDHVAACTAVTYATNPPCGGDHWAIWAAYRKYTSPVPREMYVHDLEHGAVVLLYRCADACPEVVDMLSKVFDSMTDTTCPGEPNGPNARMVLTPDPDLDTPIAAAAWGATYTATCIDEASLLAFTKAHYGKGPEDLCADGLDISSAAPCSADGG
jgi:hypothetical protein